MLLWVNIIADWILSFGLLILSFTFFMSYVKHSKWISLLMGLLTIEWAIFRSHYAFMRFFDGAHMNDYIGPWALGSYKTLMAVTAICIAYTLYKGDKK